MHWSSHFLLLTANEEALLKRFRDELTDEGLVIDNDVKVQAFERLLYVMSDEEDDEAPSCLDEGPSEPKTTPNFTVIQNPHTHFSPADEIAKLLELRDLGVLSQDEYESLKTWVLAKAS